MNDFAVDPFDDLPLRDRRPPPAPRPPRGKLGPFALYRRLRTNPITTWGQEAYERPILADRPRCYVPVPLSPRAARSWAPSSRLPQLTRR